MSTTHTRAAIIRLFDYARAYRGNIYLGILYSMLNKFFDIMPEVLIGIAVDTVVNRNGSWLARLGFKEAWDQVILLGVLTFVIWCLESVFQYLYSLKWRNLAQVLQHKLRLDAYTHIQNADMKYFENTTTGNLVAILNDDINQLERFLNDGFNTMVQVICAAVIIGAIFFYLAPRIAIFAIVPVPFILLGTYFFQRLIAPRYAAVRAKAGELSARFANNIQGIATIKSYTAENYEINSLDAQSMAYQNANANAIRVSSAITPVIRIIIMLGFLVTLVYGGWMTLHHQLGVGAYSVLIFLTQRLLWPFTYVADLSDQYYRAMASANRVLDLLATPISIITTVVNPAQIKQRLHGNIQFAQVNFAYQTNHPVLRAIDLVIKAGQTVAFVGPTGSGKSTLVKLLLRFYDPVSGQIRIDDKPLPDYNLQYLRQQIGYVSQDIFLFDGTVADNIAYGSFQAERAAIINAAKLAEAHDFIMRLPQGYETPVGERGQRLSGGQRQRLGLARAILKNPPILILDEATSAVDNETEAAIQRSLEHIVINRTTIIIAHRLSTIRNADVIYVLDQGRIAEQGCHDDLLRYNGIYASLWAIQTGLPSH